MTTGYTLPELKLLEKLMLDNAPVPLTSADRRNTPMVSGVAWNGSYTGMLLQLQFPANQSIFLHLNCVVALELLLAINRAAFQYQWWNAALPGDEDEDTLPLFSTDHDDTALIVSTIAVSSLSEGVLLRLCNSPGGLVSVFLPRSVSGA